jgi:hypothetical protein
MHNLEESSLARLMIPDVLTPAQYYDGARTRYTETHAMKRLMLAVLEDALGCLETYTESRNPSHRKAFGEAETWILDRRAKGPFAFVSICEALEIQPDHLREGIRQWRLQLSDGRDSAGCNGAPCAEASLQHRWSVGGRTVPNHHPASSQLTYALRAKRSIERWA